jgi:hypothetical protein
MAMNLLARHRDVRMRSIIQSITIAIIDYLADPKLVDDGIIRISWNILLTAYPSPMYVAGGQVHQLHTE